MGQWNTKPFDNDAAADWLGNLMRDGAVREEWLKGIGQDLVSEPQTVRAAVWLFSQLGFVYVWPIDNYAEDLECAIAAADKLCAVEFGVPRELLEEGYQQLLTRRRSKAVAS